jgi:hypothetical protein
MTVAAVLLYGGWRPTQTMAQTSATRTATVMPTATEPEATVTVEIEAEPTIVREPGASEEIETETMMTLDMPRVIIVVGEGSASAAPDIAETTIGVDISADSVREGTSEAAETMEAVLEALREMGIDESDIRTTGYSVWTDRTPNPDGAGQTTTYRVSNQAQVTIREDTEVGAVLDAAIEAGANVIWGVNFAIAEPESLGALARERAMEHARTKAEELADLAGVEVGPVVAISEVIGQGGGYYEGMAPAFADRGGGGAGPVSPGESQIRVRLQVTYVLR